MSTKNIVKVTNNGMITIPAYFRRKFGIKDGNRVMIVEDEGQIRLILIKNIEEIRKDSFTAESILKQLENSRKFELELEEK